MQPDYFRIEHNGVKFRAVGVKHGGLSQIELHKHADPTVSVSFYFLPGPADSIGLFEYPARFRKLKNVKRAVRKAFGDNIEIREPEFH